MDSPMLKMLKTKNPDRDYPTNFGQKWTDEEENTLLQELDKNINIEIIAQTHNRTIGGIRGRQRTIAYNMYVKKVSIEEIIIKTKLDKEQIMETITTRKENPQRKVKITQEPKIEPKKVSLENEIFEMRSDIKELKNTIKELVEMMKAVYEFEDVA